MIADADLCYPIGRFEAPAHITAGLRAQAIDAIEELPSRMRDAVACSTAFTLAATAVWRSVSPGHFLRTFNHPEIGVVTVDFHLQMYAWHSRHHVAHVTSMRKRMGI